MSKWKRGVWMGFLIRRGTLVGGAGQAQVKSVTHLIVFTNVSFDNCTTINIMGNLTLCTYSKLDPGQRHMETLYYLRNCFLSLKLCQNSITGNITGSFWKETQATWLGLQLLYQAGFPCARSCYWELSPRTSFQQLCSYLILCNRSLT